MTSTKTSIAKYAVIAFFALGAGVIGWNALKPIPKGGQESLIIPQFSAAGLAGKAAFETNCSTCHGSNAVGTDKGPPLIHDIYNPGHHADESFVLAAKVGVRRHHWRFGDMPPQPQVTEGQVRSIVQYIRELQRANGITYRPHRM